MWQGPKNDKEEAKLPLHLPVVLALQSIDLPPCLARPRLRAFIPCASANDCGQSQGGLALLVLVPDLPDRHDHPVPRRAVCWPPAPGRSV